MRSANDIHPGALIGGKYRVRAILGRKHGLTVDAFHTAFDQRAIIKLLLPNQADAREVERFRREARALSKIASEHVARILDVGNEADGTFYLVRQYLEGTDLERHIRKTGALPLADAILFTLQACEAVAEAHANSIVVRDLEPSHLFLTQRTGGAPLIKITDFGTAKLLGGAHDAAGEITGTAMFGLTPYASPELVRKARDVDARTDVWSLGTILYEMLAGRPPFLGEAAALMLAITRDEPAPISHMRSDVTHELDTVIGWALAKDMEGRFRSVHAFAHALLPFSPPEGRLLVDRIGQIAQAAREKKASGSVPPPAPPPSVPMAAPPPPRGSAPGSQPPAAWLPAPAPPPMVQSHLPADLASMPVDEDDETSVIPGSIPALQKMLAPKSVPGPPASSPMAMPPASGPVRTNLDAAPTDILPASALAAAAAAASAPAPASVPAPASASAAAPAPAPVAAPAPAKDNTGLIRALLAFCMLGLLAAIVLIVMLLRKQPGETTASTTNQAQPSAIAVPVPPTPAPTAAPTPTPAPAASETPAPTAAPAATEAPSAAPAVAAAPPEKASEEPAPKGGNAGSSEPASKPPPPPAGGGGGGNGTLVAVAVGGPCTFTVNGASKGRSSSLRLSLRAGTYSVTCKPASGAAKSKSVTVRPGETAMAMFKL